MYVNENEKTSKSTRFVAILTFIFLLAGASYLAAYVIRYMPEPPDTSDIVKYDEGRVSEQKESIERLKKDRQEWEKANPDLVVKLKQPEGDSSPTSPAIGMTHYDVLKICGLPDDSSTRTTGAGTEHAVIYHMGRCKGVLGFDESEKLIVIESY